MIYYDLCVAWNWEYDADFMRLLSGYCNARNLSVLHITPENIAAVLEDLAHDELSFRVILDRASEDDERFMPVVRWALEHNAFFINRHERASRSWNKAAMHYELINAGIYTPYTIVIPAYEEQSVLGKIDIAKLGEPFIVKPVHGSGGEGVFLDISSEEQIIELRRQYPDTSFLVQKYIVPADLNAHPAWFRVLYCHEKVYACWWHPETHIYIPVEPFEQVQHGLEPLSAIAVTIARVTGLDLFSTEIAYTAENLFVAVDYVNDQPDLRMQSNAEDGVPDAIVHDIIDRLGQLVIKHIV